MENLTERRKNYFIKKEFQRNFILKFCGLVIAGSLLSVLIIYVMSKSTVTTTFTNSRLVMMTTADFILPTVMWSALIVTIIIGIATAYITMFTSHKIAGPLYRMQKDVEEVASGNLKVRFNLRSGDEIKALAASLDGMTVNMRNNVEEMKGSLNELESAAKKNNDPSALKEKLAKLRASIDKYKT